jgi:hypothetical protein
VTAEANTIYTLAALRPLLFLPDLITDGEAQADLEKPYLRRKKRSPVESLGHAAIIEGCADFYLCPACLRSTLGSGCWQRRGRILHIPYQRKWKATVAKKTRVL